MFVTGVQPRSLANADHIHWQSCKTHDLTSDGFVSQVSQKSTTFSNCTLWILQRTSVEFLAKCLLRQYMTIPVTEFCPSLSYLDNPCVPFMNLHDPKFFHVNSLCFGSSSPFWTHKGSHLLKRRAFWQQSAWPVFTTGHQHASKWCIKTSIWWNSNTNLSGNWWIMSQNKSHLNE